MLGVGLTAGRVCSYVTCSDSTQWNALEILLFYHVATKKVIKGPLNIDILMHKSRYYDLYNIKIFINNPQ